VQIRELSIPGAFEFTPRQHADERGVFVEWYRFEGLEEHVGHALQLRQANLSVSAKGVVRGIHYAMVPPSQAKYVTVTRGRVIDFIVDIRVGSPTFGAWEQVLLDDMDRKAVYLAEGLGHALVSLEDGTTVSYLVSEVFNGARELGINPLDPAIDLALPTDIGELRLSHKDTEAPGLAEAAAAGLLPTWQEATAYYASLTAAS
jgi:dTDP-4-dehydrorhamnose 3,5-epimerase